MLSVPFILVVLNNDPDSKEFNQWESLELSNKNREKILFHQDLKMAI